MAVIGRRLALLLMAAAMLQADDSADIHRVIGDVGQELSAGLPGDAMRSFSKSYVDYDRLSEYFDGLAGAYAVICQVSYSEEAISAEGALVEVHWTLNLTPKQGASSTNREADLKIKLVREGKHWRIKEFGPIGIFDPAWTG